MAPGFVAAVTYEQDFDNFADGATSLGDGTVMTGSARVSGRALELTQDGGAGGTSSFSIPALGGSSAGWTATFDLTITDSVGNNPPADGFSLNYGNFSLGEPGSAEEGMAGVGSVTENISFEIDTWMNFDAEQGVNIAEKQGSVTTDRAFTNGAILLDGTTVSGQVTLRYSPQSGVSFTTTGLNTNATFTNVGLSTFVGSDAFHFCFSGRVGGANQTVLIDNLTIITQGSSDNDGDGLPNSWETAHGLNPDSAAGNDGAAGDPDLDTLSNLTEYRDGTDPRKHDTDNDGLKDNVETLTGIWAGTGDTGTSPLNPDSDGDGLSDGVENPALPYLNAAQPGTNPNIADSDGDGSSDGQEVAAGRDPTLAEPVGDILITEFMAANSSGFQDFAGEFSDWIEIYNNGTLTVDIGGWHLTDEVANLRKWTFPSRILAPGHFLIVFASDKNLAGPELHTNFRLSAGGEYLALVRPDGVTVSHEYAPAFPPQLTDVSYGLEMNAVTTDLISPGSAGKYLLPSDGSLAVSWHGDVFNDSAWTPGSNGFGFDTAGALTPLIGTDIGGAMQGNNSGAYFRFPFLLTGPPGFDSLHFAMSYDDGFAAYLNGTLISDGNAPAGPVWNSTAMAENSGGLVVASFAPPETPFRLVNHSATPAAVIAGADPFLRLIYNGTGGNHNSIHFDRTGLGPFGTVVAEFDFRMNGAADGFSFLMLPTGSFGTSSASPGATLGTAEEPDVAGVFAVGFDIYNNIDEISLHYGSTRAQTDLRGTMDLNSNVWHRAMIGLTPSGEGGSSVSVRVIPDIRGVPGAPVVFHDNVMIPGLSPYEYRVQFSARTGGATTNVDLDNISISPSGAGGALRIAKDISEHLGLLREGANVLAVHGLNISAGDSDFLARAELSAVTVNSVNPASRYYYEAGTPGAPNLSGTNGVAGPVTLSPAARTFTGTLSVTLTTPAAGGNIRYTTDGTLPSASSTLYTGPIVLSTSTRLRARAYLPNFSPGPVVSGTWFRLEPDLQTFTSNLPVVVVDNFGSGGFPGAGGAYQPMVMAVFDRQADTGRSALTNLPDLVTRGGAHQRGSSTAGQSKPNLRIETWGEEDQLDEPVRLLDFPRESDFILYAPYDFDRALMRNAFMYRLSNEMGQYAVRTRFVEVFANTGGGNLSYAGDYHGVYILMESVKRDNQRVDIQKLEPTENAEPELTGGYLWKVDRGSPSFTTVGQGDPQVIEDPDSASITATQSAWLRAYLNQFGTALTGPGFTDPVTGYAPYIDSPSWVDHHLLNVLAFNVDALRLSTFLHKDRNKPIVKGPVWDFDRSLESYDGRDDNPRTWGDTGGTSFFQRGWFNRLFDDPDFAQQWIDRWSALRQPGGTFSDAHLFSVLDGMRDEIGEAAPRNYARWTSVPPSRGGSLAGEVQHIKNWLALRTAWIDSQLTGEAAYSQDGGVVPSGFQVTLTPPAAGGVVYSTLDGGDPRGDSGSFAGVAYSGPVSLTQSARLTTRVYKPSNPTALFDSRWGPPKQAVFLVGTEPAAPGSVVISEIHYHPAPPTAAETTAGFTNDADFEFLELLNTGTQPVDLVDCRFDTGIDFSFPLNSVIPPGGRLVLAKNPAAFALRYGPGISVPAGYPADSLNNDGERLRVLDWKGMVITEFTYNDTWHRLTDGGGYSLELRDPSTPQAQLGDKGSWVVSRELHGTPGYVSVFGQDFSLWLEDEFSAEEIGNSEISGPLSDPDRDGYNNLLEYAFQMNPHADSAAGAPAPGLSDNKLTLSFRRWKDAADLTYWVEASGDLNAWTAVSGVVGAPVDQGDGTETVTITDTGPVTGAGKRYLRVRVIRQSPVP